MGRAGRAGGILDLDLGIGQVGGGERLADLPHQRRRILPAEEEGERGAAIVADDQPFDHPGSQQVRSGAGIGDAGQGRLGGRERSRRH